MLDNGTRPSARDARLRQAVLLGLLIWLAFGLRVYRLGHQELRGDEAFDALFSAQPVGVILAELKTTQPYPPLFHVGLHYWLGQVGHSEIMQRLPAVFSGLLLVVLIYRLARMAFTEPTARIAMVLAAISPFYIWHAQDGRMYSLVAMLSVASIWLGLRLLEERSTFWMGLAYWAVTTLALLTHYFSWAVLLAENVAAILILRKRGQREYRLGRWLAWQCAVVLALAPWLLFALDLLTGHASGWITQLTLVQMLRRLLVTFSFGQTLPSQAALAFSLLFGALFLLGCLFVTRDRHPRVLADGRSVLLLLLGTPLLATFLLSLLRPAFDEKYLIAAVACYLILVARGLRMLADRWKIPGYLGGGLVIAATAWSLCNYYFDPAYAKSPGWRDLVKSLEARTADGDVIVQNYPDPGLAYYYQGDLPVRLLPTSEAARPERTRRALEDLATSYRRVWLIPGPEAAWDESRIVQQWLGRHCDLRDEKVISSLRLQLYETPRTFLEQMVGLDMQLGDHVELLGYRLTTNGSKPVDPKGDLLVTLYWQTLAPLDSDYKVFVHLGSADEQIWGQHDGQPVNGTYPTTEWVPGEFVVDQHSIQVDAAAPPGEYRLMAGMYSPDTAQRLPIRGRSAAVDRDRIVLTTLAFSSSDG